MHKFHWFIINICTAGIFAVLLIFYTGCGILPPAHSPVPVDMEKISQQVEPVSSDFKFILKTGHNTKIKKMAVSPDGKYLATGDISGFVKLWDLKKKELLMDLDKENDVVYSVDFSPDSTRAAAGYFGGTVKIWSIPDGRLLIQKQGAGEQAAFSPDGKTIACSGIYKPINLLNTANLNAVKTIGNNKGVNNSIDFSPCGKLIALGEGDGSVEIWNVETVKILHALRGHKWWVHSVKFSNDGKYLASGSYTMKGSVKWQTIKELEDESKIEAEDDYFHQKWAYDNTLIIWDVKTGKMKHLFDHPFGVLSVDFSPDGKRIASSGLDNSVRLWDIASGKEIFNLLIKEAYFINNVVFTPDGKNLISGGGDNQVKIINAGTGKIEHKFFAVESPVESVSFSPNGGRLAAARKDGQIDLWDVHSGTVIHRINTGSNPVQAVCFSPNGKTIASADAIGQLKLWKAENGEKIIESRQNNPIISLNFSPDGRYVLTGNANNLVTLYDSSSLHSLWPVKHQQSIISTVFSPDGKFVLSCDTGRESDAIKLLKAENGEVIRNFNNEGHPAWSAVFFPASKNFAVTRGRKIIVMDSRTGKTLQEMKDHKAPVWTLAVNPSGTLMVSGSMDGEIILWDISGETVKLMGRQPAHDDEVESLAFSPQEQMFASGSRDSTVKIWSVGDFVNPDPKTGAIIKPLAVLQGLSGNEWISALQNGDFKSSKDAYRFIKGVSLKGKTIFKQNGKINIK